MSRGNIHTEVFDVATGHMLSIYSVRDYSLDSGGLVSIIGTKENIPPQGGSLPPLQHQDFTITAPPQELFNWDAHHGSVAPTTGDHLSLKQPSGTIVLDQTTGHSGAQGISTEVENLSTGLGMSVVGLRELAMKHPGSNSLDYYVVIEVNSADSFSVAPPGQIGDTTLKTTAKNGWYDLYWSVTGHNTVSETALLGVGGILTLDQGF